MKKSIFLLGLIYCGFLMVPHLLTAQPLDTLSLDEALLAAAVTISRELPANSRVAIVNFSSPSESLNNYVIDELNGHILRNRRVTPVRPDQSQLQFIRSELRFSTAGELDTYLVQSIGQLLEVDYVITGSLVLRGIEYRLALNAFDTENVNLQSQYTASLDLRNDQHFALLLGNLVQRDSRDSQQDSSSQDTQQVSLNSPARNNVEKK
jgi:hypothetical protein